MDSTETLTRGTYDDEPTRKKTRLTVSLQSTETIRNRLQLNEGQMSEALGYSAGAYSYFKRKGEIPKVAALAAEALMMGPQSASVSDHYMLVCVVKGVPMLFDLSSEDIREMKLDGTTYYLIPKDVA